MKRQVPIAVFASGSGTNFQALQNAIERGDLKANIALVVCDQPDAYVVSRATAKKIPTLTINRKDFSSKELFEQRILEELQKYEIEWIVLAGYMRLIGATLLKAYPSKIFNIHPSLLPAFPGKDAVGQAMRHGVKITGVTVHLVDEGMDTGPILAQEAVTVVAGDRAATEQAIHEVEHELYAQAIEDFIHQ